MSKDDRDQRRFSSGPHGSGAELELEAEEQDAPPQVIGYTTTYKVINVDTSTALQTEMSKAAQGGWLYQDLITQDKKFVCIMFHEEPIYEKKAQRKEK